MPGSCPRKNWQLRGLLRMKIRILIYLFFAYGTTWPIILGVHYIRSQGLVSDSVRDLIFSSGALGPFLAALASTAIFYGSDGIRVFFRRIFSIPKGKFVLVLAISPLVLLSVGYLLYPILTGEWFSFQTTREIFRLTDPIDYLAWLLPFFTYALLEEPGWRGFLLPHLQAKYSAIVSTIIVTIFWGLWHAPMFLFRFQFSPGIAFGFFFGLFCGSLLLTLVFNLSRGAISAVILFHLANNIASALDRQYIVATVSTGLTVLAAFFLWKYGPEELSDTVRVGNYFEEE